jgi:hypothetical protein
MKLPQRVVSFSTAALRGSRRRYGSQRSAGTSVMWLRPSSRKLQNCAGSVMPPVSRQLTPTIAIGSGLADGTGFWSDEVPLPATSGESGTHRSLARLT